MLQRVYSYISKNTAKIQYILEAIGCLKGKTSLMIFQKHTNLRYRYGNRYFWCSRYGKKCKKDTGIYLKLAEK